MRQGKLSNIDTPVAGAAARQSLATLTVDTPGPGFTDLTDAVTAWVAEAGIAHGLLTLFCRHTSASLTIQENADPDVRRDLMNALDRLAPRTAPYRHTTEGPDDMPSHIRTMLTGASLSVPVIDGKPALGTWQGIYLIEHRDEPHRRTVVLHLIGSAGPG
jgi:secondary thiamine-phosphate synthase enzyme